MRGIDHTATVEQDPLDPNVVIAILRLTNRSGGPVSWLTSVHPLTLRAYRASPSRELEWNSDSTLTEISDVLRGIDIADGGSTSIRKSFVLPAYLRATPPRRYLFTVSLQLARPKIVTPEYPAAEVLLR